MALSEDELGSLNAKLHVTLWSVEQYADDDDMRILRETQNLLMSEDMVSAETLEALETRRWSDHNLAVKWMNQANWHIELISEMLDRWKASPSAVEDPLLFQDILRRVAEQRVILREELKRV